MTMRVTLSGPMFDRRADAAAKDACHDVERSVAVLGASVVRTNLNAVLKVQTPYYRMQVTSQRAGMGYQITDQGVIYGPWLEGIGSRNFPRTRFRGYATFRRSVQQIQTIANRLAADVVARFTGRM